MHDLEQYEVAMLVLLLLKELDEVSNRLELLQCLVVVVIQSAHSLEYDDLFSFIKGRHESNFELLPELGSSSDLLSEVRLLLLLKVRFNQKLCQVIMPYKVFAL
jgi:hypothetical protein